MRAALVRIGNSKGVRLPKPLLAESGLTDEVELAVVDNTIVISPVTAPRQGWDEAFARMAAAGDDGELIEDVLPTEWEETDWRW